MSLTENSRTFSENAKEHRLPRALFDSSFLYLRLVLTQVYSYIRVVHVDDSLDDFASVHSHNIFIIIPSLHSAQTDPTIVYRLIILVLFTVLLILALNKIEERKRKRVSIAKSFLHNVAITQSLTKLKSFKRTAVS